METGKVDCTTEKLSTFQIYIDKLMNNARTILDQIESQDAKTKVKNGFLLKQIVIEVMDKLRVAADIYSEITKSLPVEQQEKHTLDGYHYDDAVIDELCDLEFRAIDYTIGIQKPILNKGEIMFEELFSESMNEAQSTCTETTTTDGKSEETIATIDETPMEAITIDEPVATEPIPNDRICDEVVTDEPIFEPELIDEKPAEPETVGEQCADVILTKEQLVKNERPVETGSTDLQFTDALLENESGIDNEISLENFVNNENGNGRHNIYDNDFVQWKLLTTIAGHLYHGDLNLRLFSCDCLQYVTIITNSEITKESFIQTRLSKVLNSIQEWWMLLDISIYCTPVQGTRVVVKTL